MYAPTLKGAEWLHPATKWYKYPKKNGGAGGDEKFLISFVTSL